MTEEHLNDRMAPEGLDGVAILGTVVATSMMLSLILGFWILMYLVLLAP